MLNARLSPKDLRCHNEARGFWVQLHVPSEQPHVPKRVSEVPELLVAQSLDGRSIDGARRRARSQPGPPNRLLVSTSTPTLTLASSTPQSSGTSPLHPRFFTQTPLTFPFMELLWKNPVLQSLPQQMPLIFLSPHLLVSL